MAKNSCISSVRGRPSLRTNSIQGSSSIYKRPIQLVSNPYLLLGLAVYGFAALYWVLLLRGIELSKAYLIIALALVIVPLAGTFLFREPFTARLFVGLVIILVGLAVAFW